MTTSCRRRWAALAAAAVALAGCSGGSDLVVRPPDASTPSPSTSAPPSPTTSPATSPATTPTTTAVAPRVTVTPSAGLASPASVQVTVSGFSPRQSLVVNQCAAKGTQTGMGDCNIAGMRGVTTDSAGRASIEFTVTRGPFGANNIVCSEAQPCLVSVSQASLSPTEEADQRITFAP